MDFGKAAQILQSLKNAGNHLPALEQTMKQLDSKLIGLRIEGIAGGGSVRVIFNGRMDCKQVTIDKALLKSAATSPIVLEDLIRTAVNDGIKRANETIMKEHAEVSKEMFGKVMASTGGGGGLGGMANLLKGFRDGFGNDNENGKKELK